MIFARTGHLAVSGRSLKGEKMSRQFPRRARSRTFIQKLEPRWLLTAIAWDGGGDGTNWSDPINWSGNTLPGSNDDVTINVAANPTIQFTAAAGAVAIRSLTCAEVFNLSGGLLTLTNGVSQISGAFSQSGGGLTAQGSTVVFTATSTTTSVNGSLAANAGATLSLPNLTSYTEPIGQNVLFQADGAGSKLLLPGLTTIIGDPGGSQGSLNVQATAGGTIDLSAITQLTANTRLFLYADGASSLVNLSALNSFAGHQIYGSQIDVRNGGEVRVNNALTSLDRVGLQVIGAFTLKTTQLTAISRASIVANGGAVLPLPGITTYQQPLGQNILIAADGAGSKVQFPNLTTFTGDPGFNQGLLTIQATNGGTVEATSLTQLTTNSRVLLYADGASALINLSALSSFVGHQSYGSGIDIRNGGEVRVNNALTSLDLVNLQLVGAFTLKTTQLTSFARASITLNGGAVLPLPGITSYHQPLGQNIFFGADGAGTKLQLPNLTTITGDPSGNQGLLTLQATNGGAVEATALTQLTTSNRVNLYADGKDGASNPGLVNVSSLASFVGHQTYGSGIDVRNGGEVRVSNSLTSLDLVNISVTGAATLKTAQLTSVARGSIFVGGGGSLSFSGMTTYQVAQAFNLTFRADNAGSKLRFPNLTSITGDPGGSSGLLTLQAFNGGAVELTALPQITSNARVSVLSSGKDGANVPSLVNLSSVTSYAAHTTYGSSIVVQTGGEVRLSSAPTVLSGVPMAGEGIITGSVNTPSDIRPGEGNPGTLTISGNLAELAGASLTMDIGGPTAGTNYDRLTVTGSASLGGALSLTLINAYNPTYLIGHTILTAGSRSGRFQSISGIFLTPVKALAVTYTPTSAIVTATIPGDTNVDGTVNTADFTLLASHFNQTNVGWSEGEFTGNNKVNAIDFNVLAANFGKNVGSLDGAVNWALRATEPGSVFSNDAIDRLDLASDIL